MLTSTDEPGTKPQNWRADAVVVGVAEAAGTEDRAASGCTGAGGAALVSGATVVAVVAVVEVVSGRATAGPFAAGATELPAFSGAGMGAVAAEALGSTGWTGGGRADFT